MENKLRAVGPDEKPTLQQKDHVVHPQQEDDLQGVLEPTDQEQHENDMQVAQGVAQHAAAEKEQEFIKAPVFLGVNDMVLLGQIKDLIEGPDWKDTHEIALMSKEVFLASNRNWNTAKLGEAEQIRQKTLQGQEVKYKEALDLANELNDYFDLAKVGFRPFELKKYFEKTRGLNAKRDPRNKNKKPMPTFSNRQCREIIDFLCIHRFVFPTLADKNYEENIYVVTINPSDRLRYLQQLKADYDEIQKGYVEKANIIDSEIQTISDEIQAQADKELPDEELSNVKTTDNDGTGNGEPEQV